MAGRPFDNAWEKSKNQNIRSHEGNFEELRHITQGASQHLSRSQNRNGFIQERAVKEGPFKERSSQIYTGDSHDYLEYYTSSNTANLD